MKKATLIITNALIWGVVLLTCANALQGAGAFQEIQAILVGGAVISMFVVAVYREQIATKPKQDNCKYGLRIWRYRKIGQNFHNPPNGGLHV